MKRIFALIILAGCMVGPNYEPPVLTLNEGWVLQNENVETSEPPPAEWWKLFNDEILCKCVDMAMQYNNEVLAAKANILRARALKEVAVSQLYPWFSADINASRTYFSKNGPVFALQPSTAGPSPLTNLSSSIQIPQIQNLYNVLLNATWEIDIFGKIRRGIEAADARIGASIELLGDVLVTLFAEIASNYIALRGEQQKGVLIEEQIELLETNFAIVKGQVDAGYADQLMLEQIEAELNTARSTLPTVQANIYSSAFVLATLTGQYPEALLEELLPIGPLPSLPCEVAIGLKSDLLRRRPDIRFVERLLAEETAYVGVAVANFFPSLSLGADIGLQSLKICNLFQGDSKTWSIGGDFNMPIFQGGQLVGNLRATQATTAAAGYIYQQTVLDALREAESALITYNDQLKTRADLADVVGNNSRITGITRARFTSGLDNKINLLNAELLLNNAEQNLLTATQTALTNLVTLYESIGGGWAPQTQAALLSQTQKDKE
jgi:outer membrane protein, multidrug efflux system